MDITSVYLKELESKAKRSKLRIVLEKKDMRRIDYDRKFDGAGNLWTSLGYFEKESDNLLVLKKLYRALKPGGRLMLHMINRDWIIANYSPSDWMQIGQAKILQKRSFDYSSSTSKSIWTLIRDGREKSVEVCMRMYSFHELVAMLKSAGFMDIEGFGSTKGESISRESFMMFVIGKRTPGK